MTDPPLARRLKTCPQRIERLEHYVQVDGYWVCLCQERGMRGIAYEEAHTALIFALARSATTAQRYADAGGNIIEVMKDSVARIQALHEANPKDPIMVSAASAAQAVQRDLDSRQASHG